MRATYSELKREVALMVGDDTPASRNRAGPFVNDAQWELQRRHNWRFFRLLGETITVKNGTSVYPVPASLRNVHYIYFFDTDGNKLFLHPLSDADFNARVDVALDDVPGYWRPVGMAANPDPDDGSERLREIEIGSPPSNYFIGNYGDKLYLEEHRKAAKLTTEGQRSDWPEEFELAIKLKAAALLALTQPDLEQVRGYQAAFLDTVKSMVAEDKNNLGAGQSRIGVSPDATAHPERARFRGL